MVYVKYSFYEKRFCDWELNCVLEYSPGINLLVWIKNKRIRPSMFCFLISLLNIIVTLGSFENIAQCIFIVIFINERRYSEVYSGFQLSRRSAFLWMTRVSDCWESIFRITFLLLAFYTFSGGPRMLNWADGKVLHTVDGATGRLHTIQHLSISVILKNKHLNLHTLLWLWNFT